MSLRKLTRKEQLESYKQILEIIIKEYQLELEQVEKELVKIKGSDKSE